MSEGQRSVRVAYETARLQLLEAQSAGVEARASAFEIACKLSATTLNVDSVSIWMLSDEGRTITRATIWSRRPEIAAAPARLRQDTCPTYFAALLSRRVVVADDALNDPKTRELLDYLRATGVRALLDAPIYRDGAVIGVVCHEQHGAPRAWTEMDANFASAVADMLTILVEQGERSELRAALAAERQAEARAEKMQALQRLGRVVAHDLNNVLTIAMGRTELLRDSMASSNRLDELEDVSRVLSYGAKLVQQLGFFCQERTVESQTDLRQLLQTLDPMLRVLTGKGCTFRLDVGPGDFTVPLPSIEAEQLVLNLCMNAVDALQGRADGLVEVTLKRNDASDSLTLEVADNGIGMDEATQARIFEPYYSTKPNHTGVGLMAVYGIVQRGHGSIALDSVLRRGTRFRITLPARRVDDGGGEPPWAF
jgi:signal transduction histidine kinase